MTTYEFGRNAPCPCGSGNKYKDCCYDKVDWKSLENSPLSEATRYLTVRGKNQVFLGSLLSNLDLDPTSNNPLLEIKRAVTPEIVFKAHCLVEELWPDLADFEKTAKSERQSVTALYVGDYELDSILSAITRLSLYCDKILLVDPFVRASLVAKEYSPCEHPDQHRCNTIKNLLLWIKLWPWIDAGIVAFIRPLHDYVPGLYHRILSLQESKFDSNSELKELLELDVANKMEGFGPFDNGMGEYEFLSQSDETLKGMWKSLQSKTSQTEAEFWADISYRRDAHPFYIKRLPNQGAEIHWSFTGGSYELAKRMCAITNSHLTTNVTVRWRELEFDRESAEIDNRGWSAFAKAIQTADLKVLDNVPLDSALILRKENRLESMRYFFRKVWMDCRNPDEFSDENATDLAAQLSAEVAIASEEWNQIDRDLLKWLGVTGGVLVSAGIAGFVPAAGAAAVTGITGLIGSRMKRSSFKERYPAGLFLNARKK